MEEQYRKNLVNNILCDIKKKKKKKKKTKKKKKKKKKKRRKKQKRRNLSFHGEGKDYFT
jgi:hypothetical protein